MTPEGEIKAKFNKGLKDIQNRYPGKLAYRMPVSRGMGKPMLDYIICAAGRFIMVEAKRDTKHELTTQQKATFEEFETACGWVMIVNDDVSIRKTLLSIEGYLCRM